MLRSYVREKSQDAFTELVRRHLDLVYSAALRQVRSPQLAEEISQSVFTDLARAADKLKPDTLLTAWLYQVARRTAIDVVRRESRRQARERLAAEMADMNTAATWTHIEPLLEDAMEALEETDRAAILLRYFENKSLREVGQSLGVSDDAAQKRVSRAVEQLREFFSKRGVTIGAAGLAVVISANAVQSAPIALATSIASAAILAGTAVHTSTAITATKAIAMTLFQKTLVTATVTVLVGAGVYEAHQATQLRQQVQTLQQRQAPLTAQLQQLQEEHDSATNQVASLTEEIGKASKSDMELLKLRGEVSALRQQLSQYSPSPQPEKSRPVENRGAPDFAVQMAVAITQGDPTALQRLNEFAKSKTEYFNTNSVGLQGDELGAVWTVSFSGIQTAFNALAISATNGNAYARQAIDQAVRMNYLQGPAVTALGKLAGSGDEAALQMLLNPEKNGFLLSSAVDALEPAAENGNSQAIGSLATVLTDQTKKALWHMASEGLQKAAANGNQTAINALKSMEQQQ